MKVSYNEAKLDDGSILRYVDMGAGRPLVYIVGFGENLVSSIPLLERWSRNFRCLAFDHRGFGETPESDDVGMERSARDLRALIEKLDLEDVIVVGYSMGGSVAFAYAELFGTDRLAKLVLADTSPKLINEGDWNLGLWQGRYRREDFERDQITLANDPVLFHLSFYLRAATPATRENAPVFPVDGDSEAWLQRVVEHTGVRERLARRVFFVEYSEDRRRLETEYWRSMTGGDHLAVVDKIDAPTLCLFAEPGSFYSPATGEWLVERMPNARLETIKNAVHTCPKDRTDEFATIIESFCLGKD